MLRHGRVVDNDDYVDSNVTYVGMDTGSTVDLKDGNSYKILIVTSLQKELNYLTGDCQMHKYILAGKLFTDKTSTKFVVFEVETCRQSNKDLFKAGCCRNRTRR